MQREGHPPWKPQVHFTAGGRGNVMGTGEKQTLDLSLSLVMIYVKLGVGPHPLTLESLGRGWGRLHAPHGAAVRAQLKEGGSFAYAPSAAYRIVATVLDGINLSP